jgi:hypothetical protein
MANLGRRGTRTDQYSGRRAQHEPPAQLAGQKLGLVEAAVTKAIRMERDRDHPSSRNAFDRQPFRYERR